MRRAILQLESESVRASQSKLFRPFYSKIYSKVSFLFTSASSRSYTGSLIQRTLFQHELDDRSQIWSNIRSAARSDGKVFWGTSPNRGYEFGHDERTTPSQRLEYQRGHKYRCVESLYFSPSLF